MKLIRCILILLASLQQLTSHAQISGVVNTYFKVTNVVPAYNGIRVSNITGLFVNDRVLIVQMKGAIVDETAGATFGNITSIGGVGLYEFATICGFLNDTVIFERQIKNTYDFAKAVQLVKVPVYSDVTVNGILRAQEWNAVTETGGVVALAATGTITLNAGISADSAGYKGGALQSFTTCNFLTVANGFFYNTPTVITNPSNGTYKGEGINSTIALKVGGKGKQSNGGGGGNNHNTGGGGGSNYGSGGNGGRYTASGFACNGSNVGIGGLSLSSYGYTSANNRIFMGGGGGAGHDNNGFGTSGGKGGGIVFIECNELIGNGQVISANGSQGININNIVPNEARGDGGGGGGGGGTVLLNINTYNGNVTIEAKGADGSKAGFQAQCPGPGGGGGGGVIWSNGTLPVNVTSSVSGGVAGIIKDALENPSCELTPQFATAGLNGTIATDFNISYEAVFNCLGVLPTPNIINWSGQKFAQRISLTWETIKTENIEEIWLERKSGNGGYEVISKYQQPQNGQYSFNDYSNILPAHFRLAVVLNNGSKEYTRNLFFDSKKLKELKAYPNPAGEKIFIQLPYEKGNAVITIHDYTGRLIVTMNNIHPALGQVILPLNELTSGVYFVSCQMNGEVWKTRFIKQ